MGWAPLAEEYPASMRRIPQSNTMDGAFLPFGIGEWVDASFQGYRKIPVCASAKI
jgi:hypothetical protein